MTVTSRDSIASLPSAGHRKKGVFSLRTLPRIPNTRRWSVIRLDTQTVLKAHNTILNEFTFMDQCYEHCCRELDETRHQVLFLDPQTGSSVNFFLNIGNEPVLKPWKRKK